MYILAKRRTLHPGGVIALRTSVSDPSTADAILRIQPESDIKESMKAIRVQHTGGPEVMELAEVAVPQPKAAEAVVKVSVAGVNSIDGHFRDGRLRTPLPFIPGQEGAGVVTAVGAQAKTVKVGDRVAWSGALGSYAEYVVSPRSIWCRCRQAISDEQAAAAMMHGLTAHYLVNDAHKLKAGETALVHAAAGGVGLLLVQMAHAIGARVIGTVSSDEKAALAREAGADEVIVFTRQDFETEVKRLTGGKGVDVVYDGVGKATFEKNLNVMRLRGMLVLYGMSSGPVPPVDPAKLSEKGRSTWRAPRWRTSPRPARNCWRAPARFLP